MIEAMLSDQQKLGNDVRIDWGKFTNVFLPDDNGRVQFDTTQNPWLISYFNFEDQLIEQFEILAPTE